MRRMHTAIGLTCPSCDTDMEYVGISSGIEIWECEECGHEHRVPLGGPTDYDEILVSVSSPLPTHSS